MLWSDLLLCCSVALLNVVFFLFVFSIIYTNNIAGKCNKGCQRGSRGSRGRAAAGTVDKFSNGKRRVLFFLNENSFSCLLCATSRRTKDEDDYDDDEKASL